MIYVFDEFELDQNLMELRHQGVAKDIEPQVYQLLLFLIKNRDRIVTKAELRTHIWNGRAISDSVMNSRISSARAAIADDGKRQRLIKTHHRQGFHFIGNVHSKTLNGSNAVIDNTTLTDTPHTESESPPCEKPSITVLPFHLASIDGPYATFADALPHEIIFELSRLGWLRVIARGSSFQFRAAVPDIAEIGKTLGVRYCLNGVIEISDKRINVVVTLFETTEASVIWSERFDGPIDGIFDIKETITNAVAAALEIHIPLHEAKLSALQKPENLDAWALYHLGLHHFYKHDAENMQRAAGLFMEAVALESDFARAHAALAVVFHAVTITSDLGVSNIYAQKCMAYAERSMKLDSLDPYSNFVMGLAHTTIGDNQTAQSWYDRSLLLRPNYAHCQLYLGFSDVFTGKAQEAEAHIENAMSLSPFDPFLAGMHVVKVFANIIRGDYATAAQLAEVVLEIPNAPAQYCGIAQIAHALNGNAEMANKRLEELRRYYNETSFEQFLVVCPFEDGAVLEKIKKVAGVEQ